MRRRRAGRAVSRTLGLDLGTGASLADLKQCQTLNSVLTVPLFFFGQGSTSFIRTCDRKLQSLLIALVQEYIGPGERQLPSVRAGYITQTRATVCAARVQLR